MAEILVWVRNIILLHSTYFMSQPSLQNILRPLQRIINEHLVTFDRVVETSGRIELVLSQVCGGLIFTVTNTRWDAPTLQIASKHVPPLSVLSRESRDTVPLLHLTCREGHWVPARPPVLIVDLRRDACVPLTRPCVLHNVLALATLGPQHHAPREAIALLGPMGGLMNDEPLVELIPG